MSRKYKFKNPTAAYFVSFTRVISNVLEELVHTLRSRATVNWIDVFTRQDYFSILEECITYCRIEKGTEVFAYCFMPSHCHLIFRSENNNTSVLLINFKGFTARQTIKAMK